MSDRRPATAVGGWWPPHHPHEAANPVGLPKGQPLGVCRPRGTPPRRWQGWRRGRIVCCTVCTVCTVLYVPEAVLWKEHAARGEGRGCWSVAILQVVRDLRCTYSATLTDGGVRRRGASALPYNAPRLAQSRVQRAGAWGGRWHQQLAVPTPTAARACLLVAVHRCVALSVRDTTPMGSCKKGGPDAPCHHPHPRVSAGVPGCC